jgi:hypothetical protein
MGPCAPLSHEDAPAQGAGMRIRDHVADVHHL